MRTGPYFHKLHDGTNNMVEMFLLLLLHALFHSHSFGQESIMMVFSSKWGCLWSQQSAVWLLGSWSQQSTISQNAPIYCKVQCVYQKPWTHLISKPSMYHLAAILETIYIQNTEISEIVIPAVSSQIAKHTAELKLWLYHVSHDQLSLIHWLYHSHNPSAILNLGPK